MRINLHPSFSVAPRRKPITKPPSWVLGAIYDEPAQEPDVLSRAALVALFAILGVVWAGAYFGYVGAVEGWLR